MIGLCGTHRTGKTALAKAFAEKEGIPFLQTSVSQVFKDMGLDPAVEYPFDVRMDVQERILAVMAAQYRSASGEKFITDRTPIDFVAYTIADVHQHNLTPELNARLERYVEDCIKVTNEAFAVLIIVQPGIEIVSVEGKASLTPMYMEHIAHLVMGITASEAIHASHFYVPRSMTAIDKRVKCVEAAVNRTIKRHQEFIESAKESGCPIAFH